MPLNTIKNYSPLLLCLIILAVPLISVTGYCQTLPESVKKFSKTPQDSFQVSLSNKLAEQYMYNDPDSSILFGKVALQAAKKHSITRETARAYNNIAKTYYVSGSYFESLSYSDSALAISKEHDFRSELAVAINTRGLIYLGQNKLNEAIPEFSKALLLNAQLKDSARIAANYFNIGLAYDELSRPTAAFSNLKKALLIAKQCKDGHLIQMSLNRIGEAYYHTKNFNQALFYFNSALGFTGYQDNWEKGFAYSGIAQTLYEMNRYEEALENASRSFALMKKLNAAWDTERAASILSKCYAAIQNYKEAYKYQTIARAYGDSILNEKKEQEINYLHLQEKKAENIELMRENEQSRQVIKNNRIVISLSVLFSLLLIAALDLLRRNIGRKNTLNRQLKQSNDEIGQQKEKIQEQREELIAINNTKDRVLSVIGHDLRSPFASIRYALDLIRNGELDKHDQEMLFKDFHQQISLVSELIDNLLAWASSQQNGLQVKYGTINLSEITEKALSLYKTIFEQKKQHLVHVCPEDIYIEADENHVRIILQNIISNAIKFTPHGGTIRLFYTIENHFVAIHIKDDGVGMPKEKIGALFQSSGKAISENGTDMEPGTGLGLLLIKQFIEENNGRIEVKSEKGNGSEFVVYFKAGQEISPSI